MKYFYFILAVYPSSKTGLPVFGNILEYESNEQLNSSESLQRVSDRIKGLLREPDAIIHSFQLLRTEPHETDSVKIPDPTGWENLPEWAMYKTMDKDGEVWIWANEPTQKIDEWNEDSGRWGFVGNIKNPGGYDWTKMIEARPAK